jgi:hypothetical protein
LLPHNESLVPFGLLLIAVVIWVASAAGGTSRAEPGPEVSRRSLSAAQAPAAPGEMKAVIRRVGGTVEVEVTSTTSFGDGAMPPLLIIGGKVFGRSRNPPDGRLNTLIFMIDASDFDALPETADVSVGYLRPDARLQAPPAGVTAPGAAPPPTFRPEDVGPNRRLVGHFRKTQMDVTP